VVRVTSAAAREEAREQQTRAERESLETRAAKSGARHAACLLRGALRRGPPQAGGLCLVCGQRVPHARRKLRFRGGRERRWAGEQCPGASAPESVGVGAGALRRPRRTDGPFRPRTRGASRRLGAAEPSERGGEKESMRRSAAERRAKRDRQVRVRDRTPDRCRLQLTLSKWTSEVGCTTATPSRRLLSKHPLWRLNAGVYRRRRSTKESVSRASALRQAATERTSIVICRS
jgi:hypothetical protein